VLVACGAAVCAAGLTGLGVASQIGHAAIRPGPLPAGTAAVRPPGRVAALPGPAGDRPVPRPAALVIPSIAVRTRLIELGRTAAGTLQVPATTAVAGWFTGSPRPGAIGSSVIAGHVDSYRGPGVFFRLRLLRPGAAVYVRRADGSVAAFAVTAVHLYRKAAFPTEAVYGPVPDPELRLITCGGIFDPGTGSYLSNVVVDAVAVRPHSARPGIVAPGGPFAHRLRSRGR